MGRNPVLKEMVTITKERYQQLADAEHMLHILEAHGIDNWEGYYEAKKEFKSSKGIRI